MRTQQIMIKGIVAAVAIFALMQNSYCQKTPPAVKGVYPGEPIDELTASHPGCKYGICSFEDTIGGADVKFLVSYDDTKVNMVSFTFSPSDFEAVIGAIKTKFGKPGMYTNDVVSNALGAKFDDHRVVWRGANYQLQFRKRADKVTESTGDYYDREYERTINEAAKHKKDDV